MRLDRYLIHYCTLEREAKTKADSGADVDVWVDGDTYPCRFYTFDQSIADPAQGEVVQYDAKIMLAPNRDVFLTDRVKSVILEDGSPIAGKWLIERVVNKRRMRNQATVLLLRKVKEGNEL